MQDTIVAIATGSGVAAIGIVRLSGPQSHVIGRSLFNPLSSHCAYQPRTMYLGTLRDQSHAIDNVMYVEMQAPHTYTGEAMVEVHCHGNPIILEDVVQACIKRGARIAQAGEFTERSLLNGKMDLLQVEALAHLIHTHNHAAQSLFLREVKGNLGSTIRKLKERLVVLCAELEASLDYPDDVDTPPLESFLPLLHELEEMCRNLHENYLALQQCQKGLRIVVAGLPNAGKSTLINAIVGSERLLVADVPGTTRDYVEVPWSISGQPIYFVDTAGIEDTTSSIEAAGIAKSKELLSRADAVVVVAENTTHLEDLLQYIPKDMELLKILSKIDSGAAPAELLDAADWLPVSAMSGQGLSELKKELQHMVENLLPTFHTYGVITSGRQHAHIQAIGDSAVEALDILDHYSAEWPLLVSESLREIQHHLSALLGEEVSEDVLEEIFSHFCIGK